jgi:hypothetical protein
LVTVADTVALLPTISEEGGAWLMATAISGVCETNLAALVEHPDTPHKADKLTINVKNRGREAVQERGSKEPVCANQSALRSLRYG